jgi:hypothetical protein
MVEFGARKKRTTSSFVAGDKASFVVVYDCVACRPAVGARSTRDRHHAHEMPYQVAKSLELEQRLARMESNCGQLNGYIELLAKPVAAVQAQLDHLTARLLGRS